MSTDFSSGQSEVGTPAQARLYPLTPLRPVAHPAGKSLEGRKLMVVDDDPCSIFVVSAFLKQVGIGVIPADRGEQAIALLKESTDIDIVLVDIMMPGMNGYATMRAMRELPTSEKVPLVAYTAKGAAGEAQRCIDAGASAYLSKPVDMVRFLGILGEWIPAAWSSAAAPARPTMP
jgi:CheY-like chemotaxis protein